MYLSNRATGPSSMSGRRGGRLSAAHPSRSAWRVEPRSGHRGARRLGSAAKAKRPKGAGMSRTPRIDFQPHDADALAQTQGRIAVFVAADGPDSDAASGLDALMG